MVPKFNESVAVKVAPPLPTTPCKPPHFNVQAPLATEIVQVAAGLLQKTPIGLAAVPVHVKAFETVKVKPFGICKLQPEFTVKFAVVQLAPDTISTVLFVAALSVRLFRASALLAKAKLSIEDVGVVITILALFFVNVRLVVVENAHIVWLLPTLPPIVTVPPIMNERVFELLDEIRMAVKANGPPAPPLQSKMPFVIVRVAFRPKLTLQASSVCVVPPAPLIVRANSF